MAKLIMPGTARAAPRGFIERMQTAPAAPFGDGGSKPSVKQHVAAMARAGVSGATSGVAVFRKTFAYQSYFDSALMERAILAQPPSEPIVPSTKEEQQSAGYGVALYPASESPIAIQLLLGDGASGSSVFMLRPGEVFHSDKRFDGIRYGLPFGWLGGGTVQLRILQSPEDKAYLIGSGAETLFHRIRLPVVGAASALSALNAARGTSANWPLQFPWTNAFSNTGSPQKGVPSVIVDPAKVVMRLRPATPLLAPARMRLLLVQTDDFDLQSDGKTYDAIGTSGTWVDVMWPSTQAVTLTVGGTVPAQFPTLTLDDEVLRIGGSNTVMFCVDADGNIPGSGTNAGATAFVDIERMGIV